jgi:hypothetical protein
MAGEPSGTCGKTRLRGSPQLKVRETQEKCRVSRVVCCVKYKLTARPCESESWRRQQRWRHFARRESPSPAVNTRQPTTPRD